MIVLALLSQQRLVGGLHTWSHDTTCDVAQSPDYSMPWLLTTQNLLIIQKRKGIDVIAYELATRLKYKKSNKWNNIVLLATMTSRTHNDLTAITLHD